MAMTKGKATGTAASAEVLAADEYREKVTIILLNAVSCAFGLGVAAVADEGVILEEIGDSLEVEAEAARGQINVIGNTASLAYQTGPVTVRRNGYLA